MKLKKRSILIALSTMLIIGVVAFLGLVWLVISIRNQRACEWANFDNIEIHAQIDVPKVIRWDCNYEKEKNTKKASFTIDTNKVELDRYIRNHYLQKYAPIAEVEYERFLNLKKDSLTDAELYYRRNLINGERSDVLFDKRTARVWATIVYKD